MLLEKNPQYVIACDDIPGAALTCRTHTDGDGTVYTLSAQLHKPTVVGDWQIRVSPQFPVCFTYTPHLTPEADYVIDMHVFRTPALMMGDQQQVVCVLPLPDGVANTPQRWYLDMDAPGQTMMLGVATTKVAEHTLYKRTNQAVLSMGLFQFRFRIMVLRGQDVQNPFRSVLRWWWEHYGHTQSSRLPRCSALTPYVRHTYDWVLHRWSHVTWNECMLNGRHVGAPQMVVMAHESLGNPHPQTPRRHADIWNQAWFSSLRSAQGMYRYGQETANEEYVAKAIMTKELALQMPQEDGLFDSVLIISRGGALDQREISFGNSDRNPLRDISFQRSPRHILDMSWTALQMLHWYEELERDERLVAYAERYARRLMRLQDEKGYFPGWIDKETGERLGSLRQSPESAVSVTFLVKLYNLTRNEPYLKSALWCMDTLIREVMPESRWEDFETYWSCSPYGKQDMVGKKYLRNNCYKQCSLSPFWMAQALLAVYQTTWNEAYLSCGERCLDEMLMYQSSFQPDYMPVTVVGGFGVMNADAELNDARQSMFAETILQYGAVLRRPEYTERGAAALRASFSMMYCPENPQVKVQWETKIPYFSEKDYGFMMENYGHNGYADANGNGIGVDGPGAFTIYDWGNGAASEAVMRIKAHFPELFSENE